MKEKWYNVLWHIFAFCIVSTTLASFVSDNPPDVGIPFGMVSFILWQYRKLKKCKKSVFHGIE